MLATIHTKDYTAQEQIVLDHTLTPSQQINYGLMWYGPFWPTTPHAWRQLTRTDTVRTITVK